MRARVVLTVLLMTGGAGAAPAPAATVVRDAVVAAGPAFAGEELVWGEETPGGGLVVLRGRPGSEPRKLMEVPPPEREDQHNYFGGLPGNLVASELRTAFAVGRDTCVSDGDSVGCSGDVQGLYGPGDGPFSPVAPACGNGGSYASLDVQGDVVAVAHSFAQCDGRHGTEVWLKEGEAPARRIYRRGRHFGAIVQVELAGRYVAWTEDPSSGIQRWLVVRDVHTDRELARIHSSHFVGGRRGGYHGFDIGPDGTIVALGGPQPRCSYLCVTWLRLSDRRPRVIGRRAYSSRYVAIAGRHVLFTTERRLLVRTLGGRHVRTLDRFHRERRPLEEPVLEARRAAWAVAVGEQELPTRGELLLESW